MKLVHAPHALTATARQTLDHVPRRLRLTTAVRLAPRQAGWLTVNAGRVWLTAENDPSDHVLDELGSVWLAAGAEVVAEPWRAGEPVHLAWSEAAPADAAEALRLRPRRGPAAVARFAAAAVAAARAAWRHAGPGAGHAGGGLRAGETIASPGACR